MLELTVSLWTRNNIFTKNTLRCVWKNLNKSNFRFLSVKQAKWETKMLKPIFDRVWYANF